MTIHIPRRLLMAGAASSVLGRSARAQTPTIRIGVLTALSGDYTDPSGGGSVIAAQFAAEDFIRDHKPGFKVEVIAGDMQDKPDIGLSVARDWFDRDGVDMVTDMPNSAIALAVAGLAKERDKVAQIGAAASAITGKACTPNSMQLAYNTSTLGASVGSAVLRDGGDSWFFISADYAFGQALVDDTSAVVRAAGGKVLGNARFPFPSNGDFSSFLVQAQASGAKVIALASAGADTTNAIKQAHEFGIGKGGQRLVSLLVLITNIHSLGLETAQGLVYSDPFYWDMNDGARDFSARFQPKWRDLKPTEDHAAVYAGTLHYLKAVAAIGVDKAKASGKAVMQQMKAMPTDDPLFGRGSVRADGQMIHDMYLWQVKSPAESKYAWDYCRKLATIPAQTAFAPPPAPACPLLSL
ncbi:ABC transporter substrate-binding protein [Acidisphaera sp. S103]|uniref:ABC transporter substrate-binding protein n=1 Tax=Acidisphaera sp. S103 TaxID=1747223 RepID=UPI00131C6129|nr:ABC transporter substrate-binding protein [Acidisphaera sp. S103]